VVVYRAALAGSPANNQRVEGGSFVQQVPAVRLVAKGDDPLKVLDGPMDGSIG
jgi:hypothetical protein